MHAGITRACSVARVVFAQCKLGCDQPARGKERKLHFVKNKTEKSAKIPAISLHFKFVNIRKDYVLRPKPDNLIKIRKTYGKTVQVDGFDL